MENKQQETRAQRAVQKEKLLTGWIVQNWQIPVPLGDCSVHMLLWRENQNASYQVYSAFIMDGGKDTGGAKAHAQIVKALKAIDDFVGYKNWRLHAWVVTHWDEDHYRGINDLLSTKGGAPKTARYGNPASSFYDDYFTEGPMLYAGDEISVHGKDDERAPVFDNSDHRFTVLHGQNLIGMDLFTGQYMFDMGGTPTEDPSNPEDPPDQPRFCVVGANNYGVGSWDAIAKKAPTKNETSILSLLYWPGKFGKGRSSYFTGGDGNPKVETRLVYKTLFEPTEGAISMIKNHGQLPRPPLKMMKLDHHGSTKENLAHKAGKTNFHQTPLGLMNPQHVLVTPGDQYGHPTWDVMMYVKNRMDERRENEGIVGKLYTTRSPYWVTSSHSSKNVNPGHMDKIEPLIEELGTHWDAMGENLDVSTHELLALTLEQARKDGEELAKAKEIIEKKLDQAGKITDPKKKWMFVAEELRNMNKRMKKDLAISLVDVQGIAEEPEFDDAVDWGMANDETRKNICYNAWDVWESVCDQPIITKGDPYFLIRFYFGNYGKSSGVDIKNDEGGIKRVVPILGASANRRDDKGPFLQLLDCLDFDEATLEAYRNFETDKKPDPVVKGGWQPFKIIKDPPVQAGAHGGMSQSQQRSFGHLPSVQKGNLNTGTAASNPHAYTGSSQSFSMNTGLARGGYPGPGSISEGGANYGGQQSSRFIHNPHGSYGSDVIQLRPTYPGQKGGSLFPMNRHQTMIEPEEEEKEEEDPRPTRYPSTRNLRTDGDDFTDTYEQNLKLNGSMRLEGEEHAEQSGEEALDNLQTDTNPPTNVKKISPKALQLKIKIATIEKAARAPRGATERQLAALPKLKKELEDDLAGVATATATTAQENSDNKAWLQSLISQWKEASNPPAADRITAMNNFLGFRVDRHVDGTTPPPPKQTRQKKKKTIADDDNNNLVIIPPKGGNRPANRQNLMNTLIPLPTAANNNNTPAQGHVVDLNTGNLVPPTVTTKRARGRPKKDATANPEPKDMETKNPAAKKKNNDGTLDGRRTK